MLSKNITIKLAITFFITCIVAPNCFAQNSQAAKFNFQSAVDLAQNLANAPFDKENGKLRGEWTTLNYDEYRSTRFNHDKALMRGQSPFEIHFFHPGTIFDQMVRFSVVDQSKIEEVKFNPSWYRYDFTRKVPEYPDNMAFAGIRIHYPLNSDQYKDELIVFQGSSYFKFLGKGQKYGLSARAIAVDSGMNQPEEFPFFRHFWMEKPNQDSKTLTLYAVLDSPRLSGAYEFKLLPGDPSSVEVRSVLFARAAIEKIGIAPLSSMFFFGENKTLLVDDFRPEVHDSDGLLMKTGGGEWVWRPLVNRQWLNNTSFMDYNPKGFGLMQRDRDFKSYEDVEAFYHERPGYWIEPTSNWGPGRIELVELPTTQEINDNIVLFWVPEKPVTAGQRLEHSYRMTSLATDNSITPPDMGKTLQTRVGTVTRPGVDDFDNPGRLFVIDFVGKPFENLDASEPVEGIVTHSTGKVENIVCHKNHYINGWRLHFDFHPAGKTPSDFRVYLKLKDRALTETWTYLWTPFDGHARVLGMPKTN